MWYLKLGLSSSKAKYLVFLSFLCCYMIVTFIVLSFYPLFLFEFMVLLLVHL